MNTYLIILVSITGRHSEYRNFENIKDAKEWAEKERIANGCDQWEVHYIGKARKTKDECQIHQNFGHGNGFEEVHAEDTMKEAKARLKEYRENQPEYAVKIIVKRVKI